MASSMKETTSAVVDIKAALEALAGHPIDASREQIEQQIITLRFPFSTYSLAPATPPQDPAAANIVGQVVSRSFIVVSPPSCAMSALLDVSAVTTMPSDAGNVTLLLKNFLCPNDPNVSFCLFAEPVNIVATAVSDSPLVLTVTHSLVIAQPSNPASDVQIKIFAWNLNGTPAPNTVVNWRCRVPIYFIIE